MTNQRMIGKHYHHNSQVVGPGTTPGGGVSGLVSYLENADAGSLDYGDVVRIDISGDGTIEKTTTLDDGLVLGVVAAVGPFAVGAQTPVLTVGYHPAVKATGAINAGDFILPSNTDGTAQGDPDTTPGSFGRALADAAGGTVAAILLGIGTGGGGGGAATQIETTTGPTTLNVAAIPDQTFMFRNGTDLVGRRVYGNGKQYDPRLAPAAPSALDDEFDAGSLNAKWTTGSSGGGSTGVVNVTDRVGYLHTNVNDGGAGSARWVDQTPGTAVPAGLWTMVARVSGWVGGAGSNQMNIELYGTGGATRFVCGMLNGNQMIINGPSGFTGHNRPYVTGNQADVWMMIQHDAGTGIDGWVSADGMIWSRLTGMTSAGTVTMIRLVAVAFSSSNAEGWWDLFRYFPGVRTFTVGGTP